VQQHDRLQPHDLDAEKALLGSVLLEGAKFHIVKQIIGPGDFYREAHRMIWDAMASLDSQGLAIDRLTVLSRFEGIEGEWRAVLNTIENDTPVSTHAEHYARLVREKSQKRTMILLADRMADHAFNGAESAAIAKETIIALSPIRQVGQSRKLQPIGKAMDSLWPEIEKEIEGGFANLGLSSGLRSLDDVTGGFRRQCVYVCGARTSMGKTQFLLTVAYNVAKAGKQVAYVSLEQSDKTAITRLAGIHLNCALSPKQDLPSKTKIREGFKLIHDLPIHLTDTASFSTEEVAQVIGESAAIYGEPDIVLLDYLGLLNDQGDRGENRAQLVGKMMHRLKALARDIDRPVIIAAQLNRASEGRTGSSRLIPRLTDLRESGDIEQDADAVLLLHRHDYYVEQEGAEPDPARMNTLDVYVAKHRDGPTGRATLHYEPNKARISDRASNSGARIPGHVAEKENEIEW